MTYNPKYNKQHQEYQDRNYDRLAIRVKKGRRDVYKQLAELRGESLAGMITRVLDQMATDAGLAIPEDNITEEDLEEE